MASDLASLRAYVTGADHAQYSGVPPELVVLNVTHSNLQAELAELKLDRSSTVAEVKHKLYTHTGTSPEHMRVLLRSGGTVICELADDSRPLGYYSPEHGMDLHVVDEDPHSLSRDGGLEDVTQVKKYVMSEEDYEKRGGTLRAYKREMLKKNPDFKFFPAGGAGAASEAASAPALDVSPASVAHVTVGSRCEVDPGARRGVVCYVGEIPELGDGHWAGIKFDEPVGKNDGSAKGRRYFECPPKYGGFVRGARVQCGDFPERDPLASDGEAEEEL